MAQVKVDPLDRSQNSHVQTGGVRFCCLKEVEVSFADSETFCEGTVDIATGSVPTQLTQRQMNRIESIPSQHPDRLLQQRMVAVIADAMTRQ
eukprot:5079729-Amphidinium_carterae.1